MLAIDLPIKNNTSEESVFAAVMTPLRSAGVNDLAAISTIFADAFWSERVMGELMHPHRAVHPGDYWLFWKRSVVEWYWDYSHQLVVTYVTKPTDDGKEVHILVGVADWERYGKDWERYWGLWGTWDLRKLRSSCSVSPASRLFIACKGFDKEKSCQVW